MTALALGLGACQTGSDESPDLLAMPTDTHETCAGGAGGLLGGGASFLSSGDGGDGAVRLGMTECALISAIGQPSQIAPGVRPGARRVATLVYKNPDGTGTAYLFVDNALKEINRVQVGEPVNFN